MNTVLTSPINSRKLGHSLFGFKLKPKERLGWLEHQSEESCAKTYGYTHFKINSKEVIVSYIFNLVREKFIIKRYFNNDYHSISHLPCKIKPKSRNCNKIDIKSYLHVDD